MDVTVRPERPGDRRAVRLVNELAFEQPLEADLVDASGGQLRGMGLAPMAVLPALQRNAIGTKLVEPVWPVFESSAAHS